MANLYEMARSINDQLESKHGGDPIALVRAKGLLASKTGFLVSLIGPNDPDDPAKMQAILLAAAELGIRV